MLSLLIRKEIAVIIRSPKFAITFGVLSALVLLAFVMGAINYRVGVEEYEASQREIVRQLEGVKRWEGVSTTAFLKPRPLQSLVSGISNDIGRSAPIHPGGVPTILNSRFNADTIYAVFRLIDLGFVFSVGLSLFAILFTFDAVCGERSRGTLALVTSNAVPRDQVLLAKVVGIVSAVGVPLLIPIAIGALVLVVMGVPLAGDDWIRLPLILFAGFLYFLAFVLSTLLISSLTRLPSNAFLVSLGLWLVLVLITPRLAVVVSGRWVEVPTYDKIQNDIFAFQRQLVADDLPKIEGFWRDIDHNSMGQEEIQEKWQEFNGGLQAAREEKMGTFVASLTEDRRNRERARQRLSLSLARLSPTAVFLIASSKLADTSLELQHRFEDDVWDFRQVFMQFQTSKIAGQGIIPWYDDDSKLPDIDYKDMPGFEMSRESLTSVIADVMRELGLLIVVNLLAFLATVFAFRKYDVRS